MYLQDVMDRFLRWNKKLNLNQYYSMQNANILFVKGNPWHHSTFIKPFVDGYLHNDIRKDEVVIQQMLVVHNSTDGFRCMYCIICWVSCCENSVDLWRKQRLHI